MRLKKTGITIAVVILIAITTGWWLQGQQKAVAVSLHQVQPGTVEQTVANTRTGSVLACRRTHLAPQVSGRVDRLLVTKGNKVSAGQLLLEMWNDDLHSQIDAQQKEIKASQSRAEQACILATQARQEAGRLKPIYDKGLISEDQYKQSEATANAQQAACSAARDAIKVAQSQLRLAETNLKRTAIKAPFAGVIAELNAETGEILSPGAVVIDLIDPNCLYVSAPIDEIDAPNIKTGMPAFVTLDALPKQRFDGRVRRVAPYVLDVEKQARTVEVEVQISDADALKKLSPGYSADVEIILNTRNNVLWIPTNAIMAGSKVLAFQNNDGRLTERKIKTGLGNWQRTEVLEGLQAGDRIVTSLDRAGVTAGASAKPE